MANLNIRVDDTLKQVVCCNGIPLLAAKERMEKTGGTVHELIEVDDD